MSPVPAGGAVRLGLVGCGRLAELGYVPALTLLPEVRLVAVADPDPARRHEVARLGRLAGGRSVAAFDGAAALLDGSDVDVVILASPAPVHVADAALAAARGKAVLVEKPPAPDAVGAAELAALAPVPWVGFNRRFDPGARAARAAVPLDGELDLRLEIHYRRQSWGAVGVHDDALADLGPHLVDWARWVTGSEPVEVRSARVDHERAEVELVLDRGRAVLSAAADRPHHELLEVRDATGAVVACHRLGGLVAGVRGRLRRGPHLLVTSLAGQLAAVARAVSGGGDADLGTAADGVAVMAALDAARVAATTGRPVPVSVPSER